MQNRRIGRRPRVLDLAILSIAAIAASAWAPAVGIAADEPGAVVTVTDGPGFGSALATAATRLPDGSVVVVGKSGATLFETKSADAWHSADGTTWTLATLPGGEGVSANGVGASDSLVVAVGGTVVVGERQPAKGFIWTSPDGDAWTLATTIKDARLTSVISTADGFLATGHLIKLKKGKVQQTPTLWSSADGMSWSATTLPGKGSADSIAQSPDGVTIVAESDIDGAGSGPGLLRSTDGATWETLAYPTDAGSPKLVRAGGLGTSADGFVAGSVANAFSGPDSGDGSVWTSSDGATWQKAVDVAGPVSAVSSGASPSVFGKGNQAAVGADGSWFVVPRPEVLVPVAAVSWAEDGTTLVVADDYAASPPSIAVHVVPPATAGASSGGAAPSGGTAPSSGGAPSGGAEPSSQAAPSDPLCDPYLNATQIASITGQQVLHVSGSSQEDMGVIATCHWTTADGVTYILSVEANSLGIRTDMAKLRDGGKKAAGLPKAMVAHPEGGEIYVVWGPSGKTAYTLGGGTDEDIILSLAKAVTPQ